MVTIQWNEYDFKLIEIGKGTFHEDIQGHRHSASSYELHFITGGRGILTTESGKISLSEGSLFVTGPDIYHEQSTDKEQPLEEIFLYLQASGKKTNNSMISAFLSQTFYYTKDSAIGELFRQIYEEYCDKRMGWKSKVESLIRILFVELTRLYIPEYEEKNQENDNLDDRRYWLIENAFLYHSDSLSLSSLSEEIGLCERQTQRLLKKYYGKSFTQLKTMR